MGNLVDVGVIEELKELGDQEFLNELIDLFSGQSEELVKNINTAVVSKDQTLLVQAAHKFKGSCLNLGAKSLGELCKELELKGKNADFSGTDELASKLEPLYRSTLEELNSFR